MSTAIIVVWSELVSFCYRIKHFLHLFNKLTDLSVLAYSTLLGKSSSVHNVASAQQTQSYHFTVQSNHSGVTEKRTSEANRMQLNMV